jgi:excisionase family DNA binding protein
MANTKHYYTTSQAAELLSVSPDTVLKWVRAGKIASYRTPGGHSRIPAEAISAMLPNGGATLAVNGIEGAQDTFRYCWDFYAGPDGVREQCRDCVAFRSQAQRCYEMRAIPEEFGHLKLFCATTCDECDFFKLTHGEATSVLVVSRNAGWLEELEVQAEHAAIRLEVASSEYECAAKIESFRPDFVVLDSALGKARAKTLCQALNADERIPFTRVIMASRHAKWDEDCERDFFGWIEKPFNVERLGEFIAGAAHDGA